MPSIAGRHRRQCFGRAMQDLDAGTDQHMLGGGRRYTATKLQASKGAVREASEQHCQR
jgi:hypothetical protein